MRAVRSLRSLHSSTAVSSLQVCEGGHDERWCKNEEVESHKCPVCLLVARDALSHSCGQLFCEICWVRCQAEADTCPVCRQDGTTVAPAYKERRSILNLLLDCPNACGHSICLARKAEHLEKDCPKRRVQCSACSAEMEACALQAHQNEDCEANFTVCSVCGERVRTSELEAHLEATPSLHLRGLLAEVTGLREEVQRLRGENAALATAQRSSEKAAWHPGRIAPEPTGISRADGGDIEWGGYAWGEYRLGWREDLTLDKVYPRGKSRWSCCQGDFDAPPCQVGGSSGSSSASRAGGEQRAATPPGPPPPSAPRPGGHSGEWRCMRVMSHYCKLDASCSGTMLCAHRGIVRQSHWSCCGCPEEGGPCGTPLLAPGTRVRVTADVAEAKRLSEGHGGWTAEMAGSCGSCGHVVSVSATSVDVQMDSGPRWRWHVAAVQLVGFDAGARVRVTADVAEAQRLSEGHGGWVPQMAASCGGHGRVVDVENPGIVGVEMDSGYLCYWHPRALQVVEANEVVAFTEGTRVRVIADAAEASRLAEGHGGWVEAMAGSCGSLGRVVRVRGSRVRVAMANGQQWTWHAAALERAGDSEQEGQGHEQLESPGGGLANSGSVSGSSDAGADSELEEEVAGQIVALVGGDDADAFTENNVLSVGARVRVTADVAEAQRLAEGHGGWVETMASSCGGLGRVVLVNGNDVHVVMENGQQWTWHIAALTLVGEAYVEESASTAAELTDSSSDSSSCPDTSSDSQVPGTDSGSET